jgi:hypothetical protein
VNTPQVEGDFGAGDGAGDGVGDCVGLAAAAPELESLAAEDLYPELR